MKNKKRFEKSPLEDLKDTRTNSCEFFYGFRFATIFQLFLLREMYRSSVLPLNRKQRKLTNWIRQWTHTHMLSTFVFLLNSYEFFLHIILNSTNNLGIYRLCIFVIHACFFVVWISLLSFDNVHYAFKSITKKQQIQS